MQQVSAKTEKKKKIESPEGTEVTVALCEQSHRNEQVITTHMVHPQLYVMLYYFFTS